MISPRDSETRRRHSPCRRYRRLVKANSLRLTGTNCVCKTWKSECERLIFSRALWLCSLSSVLCVSRVVRAMQCIGGDAEGNRRHSQRTATRKAVSSRSFSGALLCFWFWGCARSSLSLSQISASKAGKSLCRTAHSRIKHRD